MASYKNMLVIQSEAALAEQTRLSQLSEEDRAKEYVNLPLMPYDQEITIQKIGRQHNIKYKHFRMLKPDEFKKCVNKDLDYEDDEDVEPIVFITQNATYRVPMLLWFPLSDVVNNICQRQMKLRRKLLPVTVFLDRGNQFMVKLFNLGAQSGENIKSFVQNPK